MVPSLSKCASVSLQLVSRGSRLDSQTHQLLHGCASVRWLIIRSSRKEGMMCNDAFISIVQTYSVQGNKFSFRTTK